MLDDFCNSLPVGTQVALAIRLIEMAIPVWENHFTRKPGDIKEVNALIGPGNRIEGGAHKVPPDFPQGALGEVKRLIDARKKLADSQALRQHLATSMEPLTNPAWDDALPLPVRLVFTAVFNLLTFLLTRRVSRGDETHVYVAINQACDALLQGGILTADALNRVLADSKAFDPAGLESCLRDELIHPGGDSPSGQQINQGGAGATTGAANGASVTLARSTGESRAAGAGGFPSPRQLFPSMFKDRSCARCPACGSSDLADEDVGIEFTRMHCNACGKDEICDVWQMDDWYR